jgi:tRNA(Met) C34 N-acetyltransferase TmcA
LKTSLLNNLNHGAINFLWSTTISGVEGESSRGLSIKFKVNFEAAVLISLKKKIKIEIKRRLHGKTTIKCGFFHTMGHNS